MLNDNDFIRLVFDTKQEMESIVLDTIPGGYLPYSTLYEAVLDYGGSALGTAFQKHMLHVLQKNQPNVWLEGKKDQPDLYNIKNIELSFELKITTGDKILGNKTSETTKRKIEARTYLFVYFDKNSGDINKISVASLGALDWNSSSGTNMQMSHTNIKKHKIIYERKHK